jgi:hypothetical protein
MRMSSPAAALLVTFLAATNAAAQQYEAKTVAAPRYVSIRDTAITPGSANREPSPNWFQKGECAPGTVAIGDPIGHHACAAGDAPDAQSLRCLAESEVAGAAR